MTEVYEEFVRTDGTVIQAMPFVENYIDLTSGTVTGKKVIMCKVEGEITLNFVGGTTKATTMLENQVRILNRNVISVTITGSSGTFDFA